MNDKDFYDMVSRGSLLEKYVEKEKEHIERERIERLH